MYTIVEVLHKILSFYKYKILDGAVQVTNLRIAVQPKHILQCGPSSLNADGFTGGGSPCQTSSSGAHSSHHPHASK